MFGFWSLLVLGTKMPKFVVVWITRKDNGGNFSVPFQILYIRKGT